MPASSIPPRGRLAGVDYGLRRVGLALCDPGRTIASPAEGLASAGSPRRDAGAVAAWVIENEAVGVIVGLPLSMDGTDSDQTRTVRAFARLLEAALALGEVKHPIAVELMDERLTSFAADELLRESGASRSRRAKRQDALAAALILRAYLERRSDRGPTAR